MVLLGVSLSAFAAGPTEVSQEAKALEASWERFRPVLDAKARYPFRFDAQEWSKLSQGDVVKRRERLDGTDRVLGVIFVPADRDITWLAIQDPHGDYVTNMIHEELPGSTFQDRLLYQRVTLPWPLAARQWVILVKNNLTLWEATEGFVWERTWDLSPKRGAKNEVHNAVWLPVNEGGWFLADAPGGTLVGYHVRTAIGGIVPDEAALRWSYGQLEGLLRTIVKRTSWVRGHYGPGHELIQRPNGQPINVIAP